MPLLTALTPEERTTFLVVTLPPKTLRKLVGRLGTAPTGTRLDTFSVWDLAWTLVDYYDNDPEVADAADKALGKEIGESPLAAAVAAEGGAAAVSHLLLESPDPARDLAWALLAWGGAGAGELASAAVKTILADFDEAERREKEEANQEAPTAPPDTEEVARDIVKDAARARSERERAIKRLGTLKERLVELEKGLATARRDLRTAEDERQRLETARDRLAEEKDALRVQLQSGTAAEVGRLTDELETAKRRTRALEAEAEEAHESAATLTARLRALEEERTARPTTPAEPDADGERAAAPGPGWSLPVFTDEFYESIRRWDRRIVRIAFEKIFRLTEDWRHPSLRAIPLEGLPGCYRIRVATDVRLIYRPLDGGRVEILSLIDREDLQRYIRMSKGR